MVRPKKHLGQHFLTDLNIAGKIVGSRQSIEIPWVEVGPGKGVLTKILVDKDVPDFRVFEIDGEAVEYLKHTMPAMQGRIIHGDFLDAGRSLFPEGSFGIIGNFPYNISSQIFFRVLEMREDVYEVVCMIQREVALRIASPPGNRDYGILSVLLQAFYEVDYLFTVNESVFYPPPKVKSAVIRLRRKADIKLGCDEKLFFTVVKTAFNQRRKTLRNALSSLLPAGHSISSETLQKRAERLGVEEFVKLTQEMTSL